MPEPTQRNNCGVVTIFPMTVTCLPTNPSTKSSSDGKLELSVFGGSPPYEIEWENGLGYENPLINLPVGAYKATVKDSNGDYVEQITCNLLPPGTTVTTTTPTTTLIPEYDLCMTYGDTKIYFLPNGTENGKKSWLSDDSLYSISWNNTSWQLFGESVSNTVISNSGYPPLSGWQVLGGSVNVSVKQGECTSSSNLSLKLTKSDPTCTCNGKIIANANGGSGPYTYSMDGINYGSSNIFNNKCGPTTFNLFVKDSNDNVATNSITMVGISPSKTYVLSVNRTSQNIGTNQVKYTYTLSVDQTLPPTVTLTFDFMLMSQFYRAPNINSGSGTFTPTIIKNTNTLTGVVTSNDTTGSNTLPGCNGQTTYLTTYNAKYTSLTLTSSDTYLITVITSFNKNCGSTSCCDVKFSIVPEGTLSNVKITGCQCCNVSL